MLKIDIHTHILPPEIPKFKQRFGYGGFIQLRHHHNDDGTSTCGADMVDDEGNLFRRVQGNCYDAKLRLTECDRHGVDMQVLSTVPVMFSYFARPQDGLYVSQFLNDHIAQLVDHFPHRFLGLGTVPMQDPNLAVKELERCREIGLLGIEIGSHIEGKNLSEKTFFPFYQACEELGMALFIHPWQMMGRETMPSYWLPWLVGMPAEVSRAICSMIFGGVFEQFPKLRVAFAHGGGSFSTNIGRIEHGFNVRPDLCAVDNKTNPKAYLGKFYVDSLIHDPNILRYIVDLVGVQKVALGTDYPFPLGEIPPGCSIETGPFSDQERAWLLGKSALAWLGLQESHLAKFDSKRSRTE